MQYGYGYGVSEEQLADQWLIQMGTHGTVSIPSNAQLPTLGAGATEEKIQSWSKSKFGQPIVGLIPAILSWMGLYLGKTLTSLTDEDIRAYQTKAGLSVDGKIGPATYNSMGIKRPGLEMYKKPYVPAVVSGGSELPDIGGSWYESPWVIYGGGIAALGLVGYLIYRRF